jgi:hypothetical protein
MADLFFVALTILFFAASYGLILVCQRLMEETK